MPPVQAILPYDSITAASSTLALVSHRNVAQLPKLVPSTTAKPQSTCRQTDAVMQLATQTDAVPKMPASPAARPAISPRGAARVFMTISDALQRDPHTYIDYKKPRNHHLALQPSQTPDRVPPLPRNEYGLEDLSAYHAAASRLEAGLPPLDDDASPRTSVLIHGVSFRYADMTTDTASVCSDASCDACAADSDADSEHTPAVWRSGEPKRSILKPSPAPPARTVSPLPLPALSASDASSSSPPAGMSPLPQLHLDYASSASPSLRHSSPRSPSLPPARTSNRRDSVISVRNNISASSMDIGIQPEPCEIEPPTPEAVHRSSLAALQRRLSVASGRSIAEGFGGLEVGKNGALVCTSNGLTFEIFIEAGSRKGDVNAAVQCVGEDIDAEMELLFGTAVGGEVVQENLKSNPEVEDAPGAAEAVVARDADTYTVQPAGSPQKGTLSKTQTAEPNDTLSDAPQSQLDEVLSNALRTEGRGTLSHAQRSEMDDVISQALHSESRATPSRDVRPHGIVSNALRLEGREALSRVRLSQIDEVLSQALHSQDGETLSSAPPSQHNEDTSNIQDIEQTEAPSSAWLSQGTASVPIAAKTTQPSETKSISLSNQAPHDGDDDASPKDTTHDDMDIVPDAEGTVMPDEEFVACSRQQHRGPVPKPVPKPVMQTEQTPVNDKTLDMSDLNAEVEDEIPDVREKSIDLQKAANSEQKDVLSVPENVFTMLQQTVAQLQDAVNVLSSRINLSSVPPQLQLNGAPIMEQPSNVPENHVKDNMNIDVGPLSVIEKPQVGAAAPESALPTSSRPTSADISPSSQEKPRELMNAVIVQDTVVNVVGHSQGKASSSAVVREKSPSRQEPIIQTTEEDLSMAKSVKVPPGASSTRDNAVLLPLGAPSPREDAVVVSLGTPSARDASAITTDKRKSVVALAPSGRYSSVHNYEKRKSVAVSQMIAPQYEIVVQHTVIDIPSTVPVSSKPVSAVRNTIHVLHAGDMADETPLAGEEPATRSVLPATSQRSTASIVPEAASASVVDAAPLARKSATSLPPAPQSTAPSIPDTVRVSGMGESPYVVNERVKETVPAAPAPQSKTPTVPEVVLTDLVGEAPLAVKNPVSKIETSAPARKSTQPSVQDAVPASPTGDNDSACIIPVEMPPEDEPFVIPEETPMPSPPHVYDGDDDDDNNDDDLDMDANDTAETITEVDIVRSINFEGGVDIEPTKPSPKESETSPAPSKPKSRKRKTKTGGPRAKRAPADKKWRDLKHLPVEKANIDVANESEQRVGVRRSKRQRFPRLKFWQNEGIVYERRKSQILPTVAEIVVVVDEEEDDKGDLTWEESGGQKSKGKGRRKSKEKQRGSPKRKRMKQSLESVTSPEWMADTPGLETPEQDSPSVSKLEETPVQTPGSSLGDSSICLS